MGEIYNNVLDIVLSKYGNMTNAEFLEFTKKGIVVDQKTHESVVDRYAKSEDLYVQGTYVYFVRNSEGTWENVNINIQRIHYETGQILIANTNAVIDKFLQLNSGFIMYEVKNGKSIRISNRPLPSRIGSKFYVYLDIKYADDSNVFEQRQGANLSSRLKEYENRNVREFIDFIIRTSPTTAPAADPDASGNVGEQKKNIDESWLKPSAPTSTTSGQNDFGETTQNTQYAPYTPSPTLQTSPTQQVTYVNNINNVSNINNIGNVSNVIGDTTTTTIGSNNNNSDYVPPIWEPDERFIYRPAQQTEEKQQEDLSSWLSKFEERDVALSQVATIANMEDNIEEINRGAEAPFTYEIETVKPDPYAPQIYDPAIGGIRPMNQGDMNPFVDEIGGLPENAAVPTFNIGQYGIYLPRYLTNKWAILGITSAVIVGSFTYLLYLNPEYGSSIKNKIVSMTTNFINAISPGPFNVKYKAVKLDDNGNVEYVLRNEQELVDYYTQYILSSPILSKQEHLLVDPLLKNMVVDTITVKNDDYAESVSYINLNETLMRDISGKVQPFNEIIPSELLNATPIIPLMGALPGDGGSEPVNDSVVSDVDINNKNRSLLGYILGILGFLGSKAIDLLISGVGGLISLTGNALLWVLAAAGLGIAYYTGIGKK